MAAIDNESPAPRPILHRWRRPLVLVLLSSALVVVTLKLHVVHFHRVVVPRARGGGLHAGRPLSQLWAADRPEHAWFTDSRCRPLVTRFTRDHCLPLVYLASFPRSGNTWVRYLLEASTGVFTVSGGPHYKHYQNKSNNFFISDEDKIWRAAQASTELVKLGYLGEHIPWLQGIGIVAKTHTLAEPWNASEAEKSPKRLSPFPKNATRRAVLLIRDPFKSFISLKKYGATKSVLNPENMAYLYRDKEWPKFVMAYSHIWYKLNARWLEATNETHVIAYERLTRDPMGELTSLLRFLDVKPDQRRLDCVRSHLEGKAHNRQHGVVPDNETYPLRERAEVWSHIHQLNWLLKDRGLPALPLERYSFADEFGDIRVR